MSATQTISRDFLTALVQKEFINEGQVEQILGDVDLVQFFEKAKKKTFLLIHPDKCELDLAEAASKALNATYDSFDSDLAGAV